MQQWNGDAQYSLFDQDGRRLYLLPRERLRFVDAAKGMAPEVRSFCLAVAFTGARVSEMLEVTPERIDPMRGVIVLRTLKQRRTARDGGKANIYREVPVPPWLLSDVLASVRQGSDAASRIWPWSRTTAWRLIKDAMALAAIGAGPWAAPKGLRHSFAIWALTAGVPLPLVQRWLGHARITTTLVYTQVVGEVERTFAEKMWRLEEETR